MGLINFLKKLSGNSDNSLSSETSQEISDSLFPSPKSNNAFADSSSVSPDERPFYQNDEYYTLYSHPGTQFAQKVITFDERKLHSFPSSRGLYVAEILLLYYCQQSKYPKPSSGYPAFWWFEYGIRDVGNTLKSLEERGFIKWATKYSFLQNLTNEELKVIIKDAGKSYSGKKADLITYITSNISEQAIHVPNYTPKYALTEIGKQELDQNGYVPYMHKHKDKTIEGTPFGNSFTVWDINRLFPTGDATNWKTVVGEIEKKQFGVDMVNSSIEKTRNKVGVSNNTSSQKEDMRDYLKSMQEVIKGGINTPGDGFDEESKGLNYKSVGKDKEALVQFYISIGKHFDAPAAYHHAAIILRKYGMYEEELSVIDAGLKAVPISGHESLLKRRQKVLELLQKK